MYSFRAYVDMAIAKLNQSSKILNYLDHPLVGPYFAFFVGAWIYLRHYLNLRILYSEFTEFKTVGPYGLDWAAGQFKCDLSFYISTALLASLQGLNLFWLFYILRIAYRFVFLRVAEDDRSDNDDNEFAEEQRLDALSRSARERDATPTPKLLVNGHHVNGNGSTTATNLRKGKTSNRKENAKNKA